MPEVNGVEMQVVKLTLLKTRHLSLMIFDSSLSALQHMSTGMHIMQSRHTVVCHAALEAGAY